MYLQEAQASTLDYNRQDHLISLLPLFLRNNELSATLRVRDPAVLPTYLFQYS